MRLAQEHIKQLTIDAFQRRCRRQLKHVRLVTFGRSVVLLLLSLKITHFQKRFIKGQVVIEKIFAQLVRQWCLGQFLPFYFLFTMAGSKNVEK